MIVTKNQTSLFRILMLTAALMSGCSFLKTKPSDSLDIEKVVSEKSSREAIVNQIGQTKNTIADKPRQYWVDLRRNSKDPRIQLMATLGASEWGIAETDARNYLRSHPRDPDGLLALSVALAMQRRLTLASYYARQYEAVANSPAAAKNIQGLALLAQPKLRIDDVQTAANLFEQAWQSSSGELAAGLNLGHLYLEMGNAEGAVDIFAELKRRCQQCIPALMGSGIATSRTKKYAQARADFEAVLSKQSHAPQALYRLAMITYVADHDLPRAKKYLDELMVYTPSQEVLVRQRAEALVRAIDAESDKNKK